MGESAYSYSLTTFSPSGKLVQMYALNAVTKAQTSLGIKGALPSRYRDHAPRPGIARPLLACVAARVRGGSCARSDRRARRRAPALLLAATNGVVLATEKKMGSPLMDPKSVQKICNLTDSAGIVYSGMGPDFRVLVKKGRKAAQQYYRVYQELMPLSQLSRELATTMQEFTQQGCGAPPASPRPCPDLVAAR